MAGSCHGPGSDCKVHKYTDRPLHCTESYLPEGVSSFRKKFITFLRPMATEIISLMWCQLQPSTGPLWWQSMNSLITCAGKGVAHTIGMNLGGTVQLDDVAVTMVEAKHSAAAQDEKGHHYVGVAAGFVLTIADGPVLYHAGDTAVFADMKLIGELYQPEVAMLAHWRTLHDGSKGSGDGHSGCWRRTSSSRCTLEPFRR